MVVLPTHALMSFYRLNIRQGIKRGATLSTTNGFSVHLSNFPEQTLTPSVSRLLM